MLPRKPAVYCVVVSVLFLALIFLTCLSNHNLLSLQQIQDPGTGISNPRRLFNAEPAATHVGKLKSKHAFATLLAGTGDDTDYNNNNYYHNIRVLTYQLLHAPETRVRNRDIPFIVMVTDDIVEQARERLRRDGAIVVEVPRLVDAGYKTPKVRWADCMTKLRLWELVDFERVAFIDADTIIASPLDDIFSDPSVEEQPTLAGADARFPGAGAVPSTYVFAGNSDHRTPHHDIGTTEVFLTGLGIFRGGFFVIKPDIDLLRYYVSLLQLPDAFYPRALEDSLLNTVHHWNHGMPWQQMNMTFNLRSPLSMSAIEEGGKSVHNKWWEGAPADVKAWLRSWKPRMEEFYKTHDAERQTRSY
ncbi:glycosyltransferase family 8 protein [Myriangium duriaei CBS 260.36]|uniref:Glycosyltransferase family 8 protein n=1 Tax=Myriangium duriaei CBS 260.36 TaxID=1168546 RepID=A0A9P4MD25_9PEZI|nr:glycosyltransferase family 8 protein [Myriangium duriaei CBS 260.36]